MKLAFSLAPLDPPVEVRAFDMEDSPSLAARRIESLVLDPQALALVGGWTAASARTIASDGRRGDLPVVLLSPLAAPRLEAAADRLVPLHRLESLGAAAARFAREDLRTARAGLVENPRLESSRVLAASFEEAFSSLGGRIVWRIAPDSPSSSPPAGPRGRESIADSAAVPLEPPVAFVAAPLPQLEAFLERSSLDASALLFAEGWAPPTNDLPSLPGHPGYVVSFASEGDPAAPAREFRAACERAGLRPTDAVAFGWDAACILVAALVDGARTREAIAEWIPARGAWTGATGRIVLRIPADSSETPAVSSLTPSGWAFRRRLDVGGLVSR
jgi:ABC-type branched-subunit amino acid transport system substrate-binding protein